MIKLIIFDVGGVLIKYTEINYSSWISPHLGVDPEYFMKRLDPYVRKMELAETPTRDALRALAKEIGVREADLKWDEAFEKLAHLNMDVIRLANRLGRRYATAILSDIGFSRYRAAKHKVLNHVKVDRIFASCYIRKRKLEADPARRPYWHVLKAMGTRPEEAVFIDDRPFNIDGARRIGMHGIVFKSYKSLLSELKALGIETK